MKLLNNATKSRENNFWKNLKHICVAKEEIFIHVNSLKTFVKFSSFWCYILEIQAATTRKCSMTAIPKVVYSNFQFFYCRKKTQMTEFLLHDLNVLFLQINRYTSVCTCLREIDIFLEVIKAIPCLLLKSSGISSSWLVNILSGNLL